jgi:hypothetical protein
MALMMILKKRPKKSVVPPSGNIKKTVNIPAKKHGAPNIDWAQCSYYIIELLFTYNRPTVSLSTLVMLSMRDILQNGVEMYPKMTNFLSK